MEIVINEAMYNAAVQQAVIAERKQIAHLMELLQEWGQLDIKGFPLVQALVDKLKLGQSPGDV